jgi:hypothetical protein
MFYEIEKFSAKNPLFDSAQPFLGKINPTKKGLKNSSNQKIKRERGAPPLSPMAYHFLQKCSRIQSYVYLYHLPTFALESPRSPQKSGAAG